MKYHVAPAIFEMYPGYVRGVVIADQLHNGEAENPEILALLRAAETEVRMRTDLEDVAAHPHIACWRAAYGKFGARPSKFWCSIEALVRRVRKGGDLPYINDLAAIGNILSLRHLVPIGGHDVGVIHEDLWLSLATGTETFTPFGTDIVENPEVGEVVYLEGQTVLCRRWTWRQAEATKLVPATQHVAINVDGMPPVAVSEIESICEEMAQMVTRFCGGRVVCRYLTEQTATIDLKTA
jgi:DNA/RNA-binding domain of Phe-tRNA-synthetase-like protein